MLTGSINRVEFLTMTMLGSNISSIVLAANFCFSHRRISRCLKTSNDIHNDSDAQFQDHTIFFWNTDTQIAR